MADEQPIASNYPLTRILHIITLSLSALMVLVGIHILTDEDNFESELNLYWFIAMYVIAAMLIKMFLVIKSDQTTKNIVVGFLMEFLFFLPIALNDYRTHMEEFTLAMLLTNVARTAYFTMAVMKNSKLV
jgi:hypothetical protein